MEDDAKQKKIESDKQIEEKTSQIKKMQIEIKKSKMSLSDKEKENQKLETELKTAENTVLEQKKQITNMQNILEEKQKTHDDQILNKIKQIKNEINKQLEIEINTQKYKYDENNDQPKLLLGNNEIELVKYNH